MVARQPRAVTWNVCILLQSLLKGNRGVLAVSELNPPIEEQRRERERSTLILAQFLGITGSDYDCQPTPGAGKSRRYTRRRARAFDQLTSIAPTDASRRVSLARVGNRRPTPIATTANRH